MKLTRLATVAAALALAGCFIATAVAIVIRHSSAVERSKQAKSNGHTLAIVGNVSRSLYPGAPPTPIDLVLKNPHRYALTLKSVAVSIKTLRAPHATPAMPCTRADFGVGGYRGSFRAPPGSSTLRRDGVPTARWPTLRIVDRQTNQDGCKGATVELSYRALAGSSGGG